MLNVRPSLDAANAINGHVCVCESRPSEAADDLDHVPSVADEVVLRVEVALIRTVLCRFARADQRSIPRLPAGVARTSAVSADFRGAVIHLILGSRGPR